MWFPGFFFLTIQKIYGREGDKKKKKELDRKGKNVKTENKGNGFTSRPESGEIQSRRAFIA